MSRRSVLDLVGASLFTAAVGLVFAAQPAASADVTQLQITVGDSKTLELDGNPSTGYAWVLNGAPGKAVSVEVIGYRKPAPKPGERPLLGAPQKFMVAVTGVSAGRAELSFDYVRAGTAEPAKTQQFAVEVLDAASAPNAGDAGEDSRDDLFAKPDGDEQDGGGNDPD